MNEKTGAMGSPARSRAEARGPAGTTPEGMLEQKNRPPSKRTPTSYKTAPAFNPKEAAVKIPKKLYDAGTPAKKHPQGPMGFQPGMKKDKKAMDLSEYIKTSKFAKAIGELPEMPEMPKPLKPKSSDKNTKAVGGALDLPKNDTPMGSGGGAGFSFGGDMLGPFVGGAGSAIGKGLMELLIGGGHKAISGMKGGAQQKVFQQVLKEDETVSSANKNDMADAFETMRRFAPTLATDKHATKAFLREAATSGGGLNYNTIKLLAEAERAINTTSGRT